MGLGRLGQCSITLSVKIFSLISNPCCNLRQFPFVLLLGGEAEPHLATTFFSFSKHHTRVRNHHHIPNLCLLKESQQHC